VNRLRIGFAITSILGVIYSGSGIFDSLAAFGIGICVACIGIIGYCGVDYVEARNREELARYRAEVWRRRDLEAAEADRIDNLYEYPRDGLRR